MVRLLVADAHYIVRMGMKQLCQDLGGFTVAGEATNGEEALDALGAGNFDMMVLEPGMPSRRHVRNSDISGATLVKTIRSRHANLPILVFTLNNDPHVAERVLNKGVAGFLGKDSDRETLVTAMRKVAVGERFVSPDIAVKMMFESRVDREAVLRERISARELQVLELFAQGKSVNTIAEELFINSRTVSTHKARLMQKMNFKNNAELVRYAVECGLVVRAGQAEPSRLS